MKEKQWQTGIPCPSHWVPRGLHLGAFCSLCQVPCTPVRRKGSCWNQGLGGPGCRQAADPSWASAQQPDTLELGEGPWPCSWVFVGGLNLLVVCCGGNSQALASG